MTNWQPIESAPKDGTQILAACFNTTGRYTGWRMLVTKFVIDRWHSPASPFRPTHWQPLPDPPVQP